jgi:4-deoxy-L-threo-5-hexosulose-uronate ketol-isomerase
MESRFGTSPQDFKSFDTERIRKDFLVEKLFEPDKIHFVYSHYDRVIAGGAVPATRKLTLGTYDILKAEYFLERRELGIINIGEKGSVTADGVTFELNNKECLYLGLGTKEVTFESNNPNGPAKFYLVSTPAHKEYPAQKYTLAQADPMELGSIENANQRTVYKFIHQNGIKSCQLVMGLTRLKPGSVWNTMPCHVHDRRMEVYLYFDMAENTRVFHFMGTPQETRNLIVANEQAIISPPWSIHCGSGTSNYSFIWAMGGENYNYADMDVVNMKDLR